MINRLPIFALTLLLLGSTVARPGRTRHPAFTLALVALVAGDLFSFGGGLFARDNPGVYAARPDVMRFLSRQQKPFRILTLGAPRLIEPFKESLAPDFNAALGVEALGGYDVVFLRQLPSVSRGMIGQPGAVARLRFLGWKRFRWFMDLMNTRFVLVPATTGITLRDEQRFQEVFRNDHVVVYQNRTAFPRFFWVPRVLRASADEAFRAFKTGRLGSEPFRPSLAAVVEVPPGVPPPDPALEVAPAVEPLRPARVEVLGMEPGDVRVRLESPAPGLLAHGSNMASGWTASVDGVPTPLYRTDGFLQGAVVPAGVHEVRFCYRPLSFRLGVASTLAGLAFLVGLLVRPSLLRPLGGSA